MVDFNYFLAQKYALLRQNADATTSQAQSQARQVSSNAAVSEATAGLTRAQTAVLPGQASAENAQRLASARLLGEQANVVAPESIANIAATRAGIGLTQANTALAGTNNAIAIREGLRERPILPSALGGVLGSQGYSGFRLPTASTAVPRRAVGESEADYLDRINGL